MHPKRRLDHRNAIPNAEARLGGSLDALDLLPFRFARFPQNPASERRAGGICVGRNVREHALAPEGTQQS